MPRQHQLLYQLVRVVVCMGVWSALANLGETADTAYLTTLPEDPLQPVWNSLDAIPAQVLAGFREQLETLSRSTEASLSVVRTSLAALEATMKQKIDAIGEDVGDLVTDRLVNAETVILEDINKLSESLTSMTQKCDRALAGHSNNTENRETQEPTRCSDQAAAAAARVEEVVRRVDTAAMRVEETIVKVEEVATRVEEIAARVEEVAKRVDEGAARVEEAGARVEEVAARVEEAAGYVEEVANKTQQPAITSTAGVDGAINTTSAHYLPRDCADIHWNHLEAPSGVYPTYPTLDPRTSVRAFCDMGVSGAKEAGGWTVVLRRHNTSWGLQNFNRSWAEYRVGFGRPGEGEWWYGLAPLHALTYRQPYEAAFLLHDLQRGTFNATYNTFRVESEGRAFRLVVGGFSGNISHDALSAMHHGRPFSTYDRDNDGITNGSCAVNNGGGWWYDRCHRATLTATFPEGPDRAARTVRWYTPEAWLVLDDVTVKVRPTNYSHRFMEYTDGE